MKKKEYTTAEFLKLPIEERGLLVKSMNAEGKTVWSDKGKTPVTGKKDDDDEEGEDNGLAEMGHKDNITEMIDRIGAKKARAIFIDTVLDCATFPALRFKTAFGDTSFAAGILPLPRNSCLGMTAGLAAASFFR